MVYKEANITRPILIHMSW